MLGSPGRQMRPSIVNISLLAVGCQEVVLGWVWTLDWRYDDYVTYTVIVSTATKTFAKI